MMQGETILVTMSLPRAMETPDRRKRVGRFTIGMFQP
jgi:hypothetical protein